MIKELEELKELSNEVLDLKIKDSMKNDYKTEFNKAMLLKELQIRFPQTKDVKSKDYKNRMKEFHSIFGYSTFKGYLKSLGNSAQRFYKLSKKYDDNGDLIVPTEEEKLAEARKKELKKQEKIEKENENERLKDEIETLKLQLKCEEMNNQKKSKEIEKLKQEFDDILKRNIQLITASKEVQNYDKLQGEYNLLQSKCKQQADYITELEKQLYDNVKPVSMVQRVRKAIN